MSSSEMVSSFNRNKKNLTLYYLMAGSTLLLMVSFQKVTSHSLFHEMLPTKENGT